MIKYVLHREKAVPVDTLICEKITSRGNVSIVNDANEFYNLILRFINTDYSIDIKGDTLYLANESMEFEILKFTDVIYCNHLSKLTLDLIKKVGPEGLVPKYEITRRVRQETLLDKVGAKVGKVKSALSTLKTKIITNPTVRGLCTDTNALCLAMIICSVTMPLMFNNSSAVEVDPIEVPYIVEEPAVVDAPIKGSIRRSYLMDGVPFEFMSPREMISSDFNLGDKITGREEMREAIALQKSVTVREREYLSKESLEVLLESMRGNNPFGINFETREEALDYLYENEERTYPEKMLVIMARDGESYDVLDTCCAGVRAEGGEYYDECYRVASVAYNRYSSADFTRWYGYGLSTQLLAKSQFSVFYGDKPYLEFKGQMDSVGYQAAIDMFYSRVCSTDYLSFRGWWVEVTGNWESFMYHGNQFSDHQNPADVVPQSYVNIIDEELKSDKEYLANFNLEEDASLVRKPAAY